MKRYIFESGLILATLGSSFPALAQESKDEYVSAADIVVTANKREQAINDVAGSVSALSPEALSDLGAVSFEDYLTTVPGVQFNAGEPGYGTLAIRGITTSNSVSQTQGTVGIYVDGIPLSDPFSGVAIPDLDINDVERVEVLRGPQGTLFGSASLGGAVNFVTKSPDLSGPSSGGHLTGEVTRHGDQGYRTYAFVNLPLVAERAGIRLSGFVGRTPGYVDNLGIGQKDSNATRNVGAQGTMLVKLGDNWTVRAFGLYERIANKDSFATAPAVGPYSRATLIAEPFRTTIGLAALRIEGDLGFGTLTAVSSVQRKTQGRTTDGTPIFGPIFGGLVTPVSLDQTGRTTGYAQEVRLASSAGRPLEWLLGGFLLHQKQSFDTIAQGPGAAAVIDALFGPGLGALTAPNDQFSISSIDGNYTEAAIFGEATYHLDSKWSLTAGGRAFWNRPRNGSTSSGFLDFIATGQLASALSLKTRESGFNPRVSIAFKPNSDSIIYALAAKGFRMGNVNVVAPLPGFSTPASYDSDKLWSYEVGAKTGWLDNKITIEAAAFYIDWSNIQLTLARPDGFAYTDNVGQARSLGVEFALKVAPSKQFQYNGSVAYTDAELRSDYLPNPADPSSLIPFGTRLPGTPRLQLANSITWSPDLPLSPRLTVNQRYISRTTVLTEPALRQGDYNLVDLRLGLSLGPVTATLFAENIGDVRGVTTATAAFLELREYVVRPRTFGLSLSWALR